jgi:hypothetical protein
MLDPRFKTIKETAPEFTESMLDMDSVFEFELMVRWVPEDPEAACSVVKDTSTPTATNSSLIPLTLKHCTTSDCCRVMCRIVSPAQTVSSGGKSPQTSETEKRRLEIQDYLQMPTIQTSAVIGKNTDGSDITQDVDVLVWVEGRRTSSFSSHRCHDSSIPDYSCV